MTTLCMITGFSDAPMMTNQQPLNFGTDATLDYDPLNFELPNIAYGAWSSSVPLVTLLVPLLPSSMDPCFDGVRRAMDADS